MKRCARCKDQFKPVKPWQRHCSERCRKLSYEHTAAGKQRTLRYSGSERRRLTRRIARLRWMRDYMVSGLRDRDADDTKTHAPRLTTQRDLRVRWERLPVEYREYAENAGLADKQLLSEWRKFWNHRIAEVKAELRKRGTR